MHAVPAALGLPPCLHARCATSQWSPVKPSSQAQLMLCSVCLQSPWPEQPAVRLLHKGVSQCAPAQPPAHAHWPLVQAQSLHSLALQSSGPEQVVLPSVTTATQSARSSNIVKL